MLCVIVFYSFTLGKNLVFIIIVLGLCGGLTLDWKGNPLGWREQKLLFGYGPHVTLFEYLLKD